MNRVAPNPVSGGDDLDALLRAFFESEMPARWPTFEPPASTRTLPVRPRPGTARPWWTSRLALVAAVALLVVGAWLLPGFTARPDDPDGIGIIGEGTASPRGLPRGTPGDRPGKLTPDKVKSSLHLEQGDDGRTGIKITVEELPPGK